MQPVLCRGFTYEINLKSLINQKHNKSLNGGKLYKIAPFIYLMIPFYRFLSCNLFAPLIHILNDQTNCFQIFQQTFQIQ